MKLRLLLAFAVALSLTQCKPAERPINQNESLRLTAEEIKVSEEAAGRGDTEAAHKLWLHYEFAAKDYDKGREWKTTYDRMKANESHQ
jgi:hypothetical protein